VSGVGWGLTSSSSSLCSRIEEGIGEWVGPNLGLEDNIDKPPKLLPGECKPCRLVLIPILLGPWKSCDLAEPGRNACLVGEFSELRRPRLPRNNQSGTTCRLKSKETSGISIPFCCGVDMYAWEALERDLVSGGRVDREAFEGGGSGDGRDSIGVALPD
jgi:hypothetical protein